MWSYRRPSYVSALVAGCVCLLTAPAPAYAQPGNGDADKAARAVARAEAVLEGANAAAQAAAQRFEAANAGIPAAQDRLARARGLVAAAIADAHTAGRNADTARGSYDVVAGRYEKAQGKLDAARVQVDSIAQASYMGSTFSRLNVIVEATGPQDIMDRLSLVDQLMRTQQQDVDTLLTARRAARTEQDHAGLAKREAEDAERAARQKLAAAQAAQAAAIQARRALDAMIALRRKALQDANAQRAAVLASYRAAKAEEARIQAQLAGFGARSGPTRYMGGQLLMPVNGWKSSNFGYRFDPFYRVWQLHAGTDFAAPRGTPIRAAANGRVLRTGWYGGYGNYTCIDHGRLGGSDFTTCYGHQSAILVRPGQWVMRGEVIGRVGTTGASTGNHLHFETRFNGVPRNPLPYLPGCLCG